jgi:glutamate synthase (NADPH/NADH) small chain
MEKGIIDRRVAILKAEGIIFKTNVNVGVNYEVEELKKFDAVVLCGGATERRSLPTPGIDADGVVQAMDFLTQQTKVLFGKKVENQVMATNKDVIVIGGGDTGSDCIGTSNRQGAKSVVNFEIMPKPPGHRSPTTPWPFWPLQLKTSSSHQEGVERNWLINTKEFVTDENNKLIALKTVNVEWKMVTGQRPQLIEIVGTEKSWPCDLALLALGFTGPENTLADKLGIEKDTRSNFKAEYGKYQTNIQNIFTAGDMRRGQSLIVWAISEGREAARQVDIFLMGKSELPSKDVTGDLVAM